MHPSAICFVCQRGRLEDQAVLLAASLRRHFPPDTRLLAAHPKRHGALRRETECALDQMDVEVITIENPLRSSYPIGHKLAALALLQNTPLGVFLDSDVLAMTPPGDLPETLAAVPATRQHCSPAEWRYLYDKFSLPNPAEDFPTLAARKCGMPYFNSGMIALPGSLAEPLASIWTDTARRVDADASVSRHIKSPWLDQVSLPLAAARLGLAIAPLDPRWNFPSWIWRIGENAPPVFFHYQKLARLGRERLTRDAACEAAAPHLLRVIPRKRGSARGWLSRVVLRE